MWNAKHFRVTRGEIRNITLTNFYLKLRRDEKNSMFPLYLPSPSFLCLCVPCTQRKSWCHLRQWRFLHVQYLSIERIRNKYGCHVHRNFGESFCPPSDTPPQSVPLFPGGRLPGEEVDFLSSCYSEEV